jgi:ribonuclease E
MSSELTTNWRARTMRGSAVAPWKLAAEDEEEFNGFDADLDEDDEFDDEELDEDEDDLDLDDEDLDEDDDDLDDEDLDDDLIDLDDEYDAMEEDDKPHPGRFDE